MRVLRLTRTNSPKVVRQRALQLIEESFAIAAHCAEVRHVKNCGVLTRGEMFCHGSVGVLQRHIPSPEGNDLRPVGHVEVVEIRAQDVAHCGQIRSLGGKTIQIGDAVAVHQVVEVPLIHHLEGHLRIEVAKSTNLSILLRHETLFRNGDLNEQIVIRQ